MLRETKRRVDLGGRKRKSEWDKVGTLVLD